MAHCVVMTRRILNFMNGVLSGWVRMRSTAWYTADDKVVVSGRIDVASNSDGFRASPMILFVKRRLLSQRTRQR